jgi:hypothetical protein
MKIRNYKGYTKLDTGVPRVAGGWSGGAATVADVLKGIN